MFNAPPPDLLHTFVTIVESGSFTLAAKRVHRTQSAVSMQIRRLESILGRELFDRTGRTFRLTADGETFYDRARQILRLYLHALSEFDESPLDGEVSIGLPDDYAKSFLPQILPRFRRTYTSVRLNIICEPSRRLASMVSDGSVDIALVTEGESMGGGIVVHRERLIWVTSAHHHAHELDPIPLAVFHTGDVFRRYAIQQLEESGRRTCIAVNSPSFAGIDAALEAGIAVAVIFRSSVRPGLRILGEKNGFPELPKLGIVLHRTDHEPHQMIDRLADHIVEGFRQLPANRE